MFVNTDGEDAFIPGLVSVIIPSFNAAFWIKRAVDSARAQTYRPLEVIIVDDGSTDGTLELLRQTYGACPEVKILHQENQGCAVARNNGAATARGEYFAFLDADDFWTPWKLEAQFAALRDHSDWGLCGTDACVFYPEEMPAELARSSETGEISQLTHERLLHPELEWIWASSSLVRRSAFQACGGFDGKMRRVEDLDLWLRIAWAFGVVVLSAKHLGYQETPDSLSKSHLAQEVAVIEVLSKWLEKCPETVPQILRRRVQSMTRKMLRAGKIADARAVCFHERYGQAESWRARFSFLLLIGLCRLHRAIRGRD